MKTHTLSSIPNPPPKLQVYGGWCVSRWLMSAVVLACVCLRGGCGAQLDTLRCGCVERRLASEELGRVVRHGVGLLMLVR